MKRFLVTVFLIITLFVLQGTLFKEINFADTVPNLLLILTVSLGLMRGDKEGMLIGFFSGLILDIFSGQTIGLYALILMYIGYLNGGFSKIFFPEDIKLPMIMIIVSDFIYGFCIYVILFLLRGKTDFGFYLKQVIIPEGIYTIVVTILLYPLIMRINKLLEKDEMRKARKFVS